MLGLIAYVALWLIFLIIWSTIIGNSHPILSSIVQQATVFSLLIGLAYSFSADLSEPVAALLAVGLVIISEIFVFRLVASKPTAEDRVFFGVQLTIAIPVGFMIAYLTGAFFGLTGLH